VLVAGQQGRIDRRRQWLACLAQLRDLAVELCLSGCKGGLGGGDGRIECGGLVGQRGRLGLQLAVLFEVGQLPVVHLVALRGEAVDLVHQRLGLARRDDRLQLLLEPGAVGGQRGAVVLELLDRGNELVGAGRDRRLAVGNGLSGRRRVGERRSFRQVGPPVPQLIRGRVEPLEFEEVSGQHDTTLLPCGVVGMGARGSSTFAGIVVPPSTRS
jgi:hypothetical protein